MCLERPENLHQLLEVNVTLDENESYFTLHFQTEENLQVMLLSLCLLHPPMPWALLCSANQVRPQNYFNLKLHHLPITHQLLKLEVCLGSQNLFHNRL